MEGLGGGKTEKAATRRRTISYTVLFLVAGAAGWLGMLLLT